VRLKVIACRLLQRELCHVAARAPHMIDLEFAPLDFHDDPEKGAPRLQQMVDAVPPEACDAVLVGFGLCEKMLGGLAARHTPLVIPRGHDCLTFFLGSKERYSKVFFGDPRTYYYTSGWVEKNELTGDGLVSQSGGSEAMPTYQHYVEKYGEEAAKALMEMMEGWKEQYHRALYIAFPFLDALPFRDKVHGICDENGWNYAEVEGDLGLFERWLAGQWDAEDFLVVPPGRRVASTLNDAIIGLAD